MEWHFSSFQKIVESSSKWQLDEKEARMLNRLEWVVTEKIHGANFCFLTDGFNVQCAKRKAVLNPAEDFFSHQQVKARLQEQIVNLFDDVKAEKPEVAQIAVYGELFGGSYPHSSDNASSHTIQPVQTGVYYSPFIEFCAFDIALLFRHHQEFLDYDIAMAMFKKSDLFYAVPLHIGSLQEALDFPIPFETKIPKRLNLPEMKHKNMAEGIVIKPLKTVYVSQKNKKVRPLLKRKIEAFSEKQYHQAKKWDFHAGSHSELEYEMLARINENRLNNALSKHGSIETIDPTIIEAEIVSDVWAELLESQHQQLQQLNTVEKTRLEHILQTKVKVLIKKYGK